MELFLGYATAFYCSSMDGLTQRSQTQLDLWASLSVDRPTSFLHIYEVHQLLEYKV